MKILIVGWSEKAKVGPLINNGDLKLPNGRY